MHYTAIRYILFFTIGEGEHTCFHHLGNMGYRLSAITITIRSPHSNGIPMNTSNGPCLRLSKEAFTIESGRLKARQDQGS